MIAEGDRKEGDDGTVYEYQSGQWVAVDHALPPDGELNQVVITHRRSWWILLALASAAYFASQSRGNEHGNC